MNQFRRTMPCILVAALLCAVGAIACAQSREARGGIGPASELSVILGRPTNCSITLSVLSATETEARVEYGVGSGTYTDRTPPQELKAGIPIEFELGRLKPDTQYFYRLLTCRPGAQDLQAETEGSFRTQRPPGSTFTFALQGDSHPEREGRMYDASLYVQTLRNVARDAPDFYITMGDDFSIDPLIGAQRLNQPAVAEVYARQRSFLGLVGRSSALFLVNGNHEQAALANLDGTPNNAAVMAGLARTRYFPLPAPDAFYSGDADEVPNVGLPRDYYAWTWGDALFVVIDPYWHSTVPVDSEPGGGRDGRGGGGGGRKAVPSGKGTGAQPRTDAKAAPVDGKPREKGRKWRGGQDAAADGSASDAATGSPAVVSPAGRDGKDGGGWSRDLWGISLGDTQYRWLVKTLTESHAKWKFVFCHHVLGTGRGGIEMAGLYEWGGHDRNGAWLFPEKRPGWEQPIHQLMAYTGVTILFQGHDHLYARQALDGIVYQSCPNPADATYQAFNRNAYLSGDILPNSGHLRVTVSPESVTVDYVRSFLPGNESTGRADGAVAHSYRISARAEGRNP